MSIQAVAWVLENSKATGSARLVLISLANRANLEHNWECWPASRTTAREAGVKSHATVLTAVEKLEALGELEVLDRGSARSSMRCRLTFMGERSELDRSDGNGGQPLTAAVSPDQPQRSAQTDQNRKEPEPTDSSRAPSARIPADWGKHFDAWYEGYPRKKARQDARTAYRAALRAGRAYDELNRARDRLTAEAREPQFNPYPATFLRRHLADYLDDNVAMPERDEPRPARPAVVERCPRCGYLSFDCVCPVKAVAS